SQRVGVPVDVNADGLTDLFLRPNAAGAYGRLLISTVDGFISDGVDFNGLSPTHSAFPLDADGDGDQDILFVDVAGTAQSAFLQSNGATLQFASTPYAAGHGISVGDFNGDGRTDVLSVLATAVLTTSPGMRPDLITRVENGTGSPTVDSN